MQEDCAVLRLALHSLHIALVLTFVVTAVADEPDFGKATRDPYNPPPTKSINGKSIAEMKEAVKEKWADIVFEKDGKQVNYVATFQTDAGDIQIEFYPDLAPNHVRSFIALSSVGFFDGLIFHRCIPGFVIQGGCPSGTGMGGPGYCLKAEFSDKKHVRGTLSMARATPVDSGGSQFFICVDDTPPLDNKYTVFGHVIKGMDVVDKIVSAKTGARDRPLNPVKIKSVKIETK
jgi:peptidyl-prolyl cis-trans isomerase B (cyclophilin B)